MLVIITFRVVDLRHTAECFFAAASCLRYVVGYLVHHGTMRCKLCNTRKELWYDMVYRVVACCAIYCSSMYCMYCNHEIIAALFTNPTKGTIRRPTGGPGEPISDLFPQRRRDPEVVVSSVFIGSSFMCWGFAVTEILTTNTVVWPIYKLRIWSSEGLTQADSKSWGVDFPGP